MSESIIVVNAEIVDKAKQAETIDSQIIDVLQWMNKTLGDADGKKAKLGRLLLEVSEKELYRELGFLSFDKWLAARVSKYGNLGRSQLYATLFISRHLLPHVDEKQFEAIGINKARVLAQAIKATGVAPKPEILEAAANPRVTESALRQQVVEAYNMPESTKDKGRWYDLGNLGAIYATAEEWSEIKRAIEIAMMTDPIMKAEASDSAKLLDALLKMSRDFISGNEAETDGAAL